MTPFPSPDEAAMGDFDDMYPSNPLTDTEQLIHEVTGEGLHTWEPSYEKLNPWVCACGALKPVGGRVTERKR